jgi:hypothetical protein
MNNLVSIKNLFFERMEDEIGEWVRLVKKLVGTFDSLCLICCFCGCFLQPDLINEDCFLNKKSFDEV